MEDKKKNLLQRFLSLSGTERALLLRSFVFLPLMSAAVPVFGLKRLQGWLERRAGRLKLPASSSSNSAILPIAAVVRIVAAASHYGMVRGNCLSQSLVLWHLLRQQGHHARLCLGGRKEGASFEAHAWVEAAGQPVNDRQNLRELFNPMKPSAVSAQRR